MTTPQRLKHFVLPAVISVWVLLAVDDPSMRFPLLIVTLPLYLRAAATWNRVQDVTASHSRAYWWVSVWSFTMIVFGWTVFFAILTALVASVFLGYDLTADVMKISLVVGAGGFVLAAWFWWPWYARLVLASWPKAETRIFVATQNRWDVLLRAYQMQKMQAAGVTRWRGFAGVTSVIVLSIAISAAGASTSIAVALFAALGAALLPFLHIMIVQDAHTLCTQWQAARDAEIADSGKHGRPAPRADGE